MARVPALEIERRVTEAVREVLSALGDQHLSGSPPHRQESTNAPTDLTSRDRGVADTAVLSASVERVVISHTMLEVELAEGRVSDDQNRIIIVPWTRPSTHRRREIVQGQSERPLAMRPMEAKARGRLIGALCDGHRRRLDELIANPGQAIEPVAMREGKSERWIRRTLSLALLCPSLVQAGVDGRLPRGFGVKRLMDLPLMWTEQWTALGLKTPIQI